MIISEEQYLAHYGTPRKSGRYPYGSGGDENIARNRTFLTMVEDMRKKGMSPTEIASGLGMTTTELRAKQTIAVNERKRENIARAEQLRDKGMGYSAIGREMGINESSVRSLLAPGAAEKADTLLTISDMLKRQVDEKTYIDIGEGIETHLGIKNTKLKSAVAILKEEGYEVHNVQVDQVAGGGNNKTSILVLAPPGTTYRDIVANQDKIRLPTEHSEDGGRTMLEVHPPLQISSKRVAIKYGDEGGEDADGVIYVRPGVKDVSIGQNQYAQVRIAVEGTHYLKGMAVYKDDLPKGVDLMFNTNKMNTGNKLDAMKKVSDDVENPFGSITRQLGETGPDGKYRVTSAMNIVGMKEGSGVEGGWDTWSKNLPSQFLSKQSPRLAQQQLDETYRRRKAELDDIKSLTNPVVRKKLLEEYADGADSSAVHLKAAALPRQSTKVLLPVNSLKDGEVYAPSFRPGERVALVRFPHGGTFEIPELTVNNGNREGQKLLGKDPQDAIGINAKVAKRLSGADFDGDTVLVIPNNGNQVRSSKALKELQSFDPMKYKLPDDAPRMKSRTKQTEMGKVSNLITDMTVRGAPTDEIARAVKHSMVVIDAEKHHLDYKRSAKENGIQALKIKYQGDVEGGSKGLGSATIISRAKSPTTVPLRKDRKPQDGGPIDYDTGRKMYGPPETYVDRNGVTRTKTTRIKKLEATEDAYTLVGDKSNRIENIYAGHSNRMKGLANEARKEVVRFKPPLVSKSAKVAYAEEVKSLNAKLDLARRNKPLERQAQVLANATLTQKRQANPDMDDSDLKKEKTRALATARARTGAQRNQIVPTDKEWAAIQAGAVSHNQLSQILNAADMKAVRQLATPPRQKMMTSSKSTQAKSMLARGYTQAEVADALGVSLSTLKNELSE